MATLIPVASFAAAPVARQVLPGLLLMMALLSSTGAHAAAPDTQADVGYQFDDNVARAKSGGMMLVDRSYSANLSRPVIFPLAEHERIVLNGTLGAEVFDRYKGLSRLSETVHGEFQYRSSAEFGTPLFALFARVMAEQYRSWLRDGIRYAAGVSLRQDITDRIRLFAAASHNVRHANSEVFDDKDNAARINLDYATGYADTLYLGGEYRRGETAISGSPAWSTYNYNAYTLDDAFPGAQVYSFQFDATTVLTTLGYNMKIGARGSLDFSWRRARSSVEYVTPSWGKATLSYVTNQYSLAYLVRF